MTDLDKLVFDPPSNRQCCKLCLILRSIQIQGNMSKMSWFRPLLNYWKEQVIRSQWREELDTGWAHIVVEVRSIAHRRHRSRRIDPRQQILPDMSIQHYWGRSGFRWLTQIDRCWWMQVNHIPDLKDERRNFVSIKRERERVSYKSYIKVRKTISQKWMISGINYLLN